MDILRSWSMNTPESAASDAEDPGPEAPEEEAAEAPAPEAETPEGG